MKTPHEFYMSQIGKAVDVDGYYGPQCWDLFAFFCKVAGYPVFNCTTSGFVKDIWYNRKTSGILNFFDEAPVNKMQDGDWVIWGNCKSCPDSHIAMFRKYEGSNAAIFLGQNQAGQCAANQVCITLNGILGALRPKCYLANDEPVHTDIKEGDIVGVREGVKDYNGTPASGVKRGVVCYRVDELCGDRAVLDMYGICTPFHVADLFKEEAKRCPYKQSGTVVAVFDQIRVRNAASLTMGDTGKRYNKGDVLNYTEVIESDGYFWAKYKSYSGDIHYCALCKTDGTSQFWKQK